MSDRDGAGASWFGRPCAVTRGEVVPVLGQCEGRTELRLDLVYGGFEGSGASC